MLARFIARFKALFARFPWLTTALAWVVFASGTVWRWVHVLRLHDPRDYVNSDMALYVGLAKRLAKPGYKLSVSDITHPPGVATVLSWLYSRDESMLTMTYFQFIVCALVPLAVAGLGWVAFGKPAAKAALVVSSLYFPFVDYGGYFLAEIHMIFTIPLSLCLFLVATRQKKLVWMVVIGLLAGFVFSLSMALKALAFPAVACFVFIYFVFSQGPSRKLRAAVIVALAVGAVPINAWQIKRCTAANEDRFCLGSNKTASDFLLGHYGRIQTMTWRDPKSRGAFTFGSPAAYQHGYTDKPEVNFAMTDNKRNFAAAITWIKKNPAQAALLSVEHVYDLFFGSFPWPSVATKYWPGAAAFHYVFICLLLFPSWMRCIDIVRKEGMRAFLRSNELLILSPVIGLVVSAAIATGEPRYRIPFDSLFMIVSIEFFRRWRESRGVEEPPAIVSPPEPVAPARAEEPAAAPIEEPPTPLEPPAPVEEPAPEGGSGDEAPATS